MFKITAQANNAANTIHGINITTMISGMSFASKTDAMSRIPGLVADLMDVYSASILSDMQFTAVAE